MSERLAKFAQQVADEEVQSLRAEVARLRLAIRRLAEQDATLSVQGGNVIVEMDATLTDEEREAIAGVLTGRDHLVIHDVWKDEWKQNCDTLRGLRERLGGGR